jgi:hypothetical protein
MASEQVAKAAVNLAAAEAVTVAGLASGSDNER